MPKQSSIEVLSRLPILFRKVEVEKWTPYAPVFLTRAVRKGWIHRLSGGYYVNDFLKGWPSVEEVGCFLRAPSYISGEWALHKYGILLQAPRTCTVITLKSSVGERRCIDYQGITLEFSRITPKLFWGFKREGGTTWQLLKKRSSICSIYGVTSPLRMNLILAKWILKTYFLLLKNFLRLFKNGFLN